jgi:hypothetical protein
MKMSPSGGDCGSNSGLDGEAIMSHSKAAQLVGPSGENVRSFLTVLGFFVAFPLLIKSKYRLA